jgi:hypothetical protein
MENGEARGMKIVPVAQGEQDLDIMKIIVEIGYRGPIGLLNHTDEDAEERLSDNLDGLRWLVKSLSGQAPGEKPRPRSWARPAEKAAASSEPRTEPSVSAAFGQALSARMDAGVKDADRTRPFTIECRAKLASMKGFNILVARDAKASADHWELYTAAKTGQLAFFQPGCGWCAGLMIHCRHCVGNALPQGPLIVEGKVCVQGRDQITRLHDLNGDDEADFYECVTHAMESAPGGHDYITGCEHDGQHFYFASGNQGVCRVRPGEPVEVLGTGLRNPNGLGLASDGTLTSSVQEGDWTPASAIMQVKRGDYFGHGGRPRPVTPPLCLNPSGVSVHNALPDNSARTGVSLWMTGAQKICKAHENARSFGV